GPNLVAVVGRSVAETEPTKRIGGCLGGEGARGNDNGGERRKAAQLVHDWLPFPCPLSRPRGRPGSKLGEKKLPPGGRALVYGSPKPIEWRGGRRSVGQKEVPAVGDLTAGALSRRSIRHGHEGEPWRPKRLMRAFRRQSSTPEILAVCDISAKVS